MAEEQYISRATGQPIPGVRATTPDNLPEIDNYDDVADLPLVYNELAAGTQTGLSARMKPTDPSTTGTVGYRRIHASTAAPTAADGADGDIWMQTV